MTIIHEAKTSDREPSACTAGEDGDRVDLRVPFVNTAQEPDDLVVTLTADAAAELAEDLLDAASSVAPQYRRRYVDVATRASLAGVCRDLADENAALRRRLEVVEDVVVVRVTDDERAQLKELTPLERAEVRATGQLAALRRINELRAQGVAAPA